MAGYVPGTAAVPAAIGAMDPSEYGAIAAPAPVGPMGSVITPEGVRRSLRLNPKLAAAVAQNSEAIEEAAEALPDTLALPADAMDYLPGGAQAGGRRGRQRGGDLTDQQKRRLAVLTTSVLVAAAAAYFNGLSGAIAALGGQVGVTTAYAMAAGEKATSDKVDELGEYLRKRGAFKAAKSVGRLGTTTVELADKSVALALAIVRFPIAGGTAVLGTLGKLIERGAGKLQELSSKLENPDTHEEQADLIIKNGTLSFATALAALSASGVLPLMTILSAMLWAGKLYTTPVGRAVAVVELYLWWINQTDSNKKATAQQVKKLVEEAKKEAGVTKEWLTANAPKVKEAMSAIAAKVGDAGARFREGWVEGMGHENPVAAAMALSFLRAAGLGLDPKAPPPKEEEDEDGALEKLAVSLIQDAVSAGPGGVSIDAAKLADVVKRLEKLQKAKAEVEELREKLGVAKGALARRLEAAAPGAGPLRGPRAPVTGEPVAEEAPPPRAAETRKRRAAEPEPEPSPGRITRSRAAAGVGGRRKTRRKRIARRVTKKFYY